MESQPAVRVCQRKAALFAGKTRAFLPKILAKAPANEAAELRFPSVKPAISKP